MKQLTLIVALLVATVCVACSPRKETKAAPADTKTLVAYFSATGVTKGVATQLAEVAGADLYEIAPAQPYTEADLDWRDKQSRSTLEMQDLSSRPSLADTTADLSAYETIYIGFPIWWYTAPTIINTFIETYDLQGKTLIPFATSGGSTIEKACNDLKAAYPNLQWKEGRLLNMATADTLKAWIAE